MGRRGPPPKPAEALESEWRQKQRESQTVEAERARPKMPRWLKKDAAAIWKRVLPRLEFMGVVRLADEMTLARYCYYFAEWHECRKVIQRKGRTFTKVDTQGNKIERPRVQIKMMMDLEVRLSKIEREFGLTPSARTNMVVTHVEPTRAEADTEDATGGTDHHFPLG